MYMRSLGLVAGDLDDGQTHWAAERRKIDRGDVSVAIVGASRILFNTDLDEFERLTGVRPVQLALAGTPPAPFLADLADDPDFTGLAIVGVTPAPFFRRGPGRSTSALKFAHTQSPASRWGHDLMQPLQRVFAFLDDEYRLARHFERAPLPRRIAYGEPYDDVWKLSVSDEGRQFFLWDRVETDPVVRAHAIHGWLAMPNAPVQQKQIDATIANVARSVAKIRAKGGEVVFVKSPASGALLQRELTSLPNHPGTGCLSAPGRSASIMPRTRRRAT
jgi:hypothetical protein